MDAYHVNWDERPEHQPIEYEGDTVEVREGCEVSLGHNGKTVFARVVRCGLGEPNIAEVTGFLGHDADGIGELTIGCTILFWDRHVFSCAA
ncbi:MAG: hypothetical protein ACYS15_06845 [Planctomycetota bacterium]